MFQIMPPTANATRSDFDGKMDRKTPSLFDKSGPIHQNKRLSGDLLLTFDPGKQTK